MKAADINPISDLATVRDFPSMETLVAAVAEGTCDATGVPANVFEQYAEELAEIDQESIRVVQESSPLPYGLLMYPVELPLGERITLTDSLIEFSTDAQVGPALRTILGQDAIVPVEEGDLDAFIEFLEGTGLDFSLLGN
jgi:ABC-type phosphate/phosphonate transport system substrate-binding protein